MATARGASDVCSSGPPQDSIPRNYGSTPTPREEAVVEKHEYVLPIAFMAASAIAATSATSIFAYARILCSDPVHCEDEEQSRYAGVVAFTTMTANIFGILAVGGLRSWMELHPKYGLRYWLICRSMGAGLLAIGVLMNNIYIAVAARIFDGLATDNILHFTLAAIYIRARDQARISRLMGTSLGLYMVGTSISPALITFLPNFLHSFAVAIALLGISFLYLEFFVPLAPSRLGNGHHTLQRIDMRDATTRNIAVLEPLWLLHKQPILLFPALAICFYNSAQAYLFPALMVYGSIRFGFTGKENGYVVSLAAGTSSVYLFILLWAVPRAQKRLKRATMDQIRENDEEHPAHDGAPPSTMAHRLTSDYLYAITSMTIQLIILPTFALVKKAKEVYGLVVLIALGLTAPSFLKSYAVATTNEKSLALANMAIMESIGGLLSPVILGTIQSSMGHGWVFIAASFLVGAAMLCLIGSLIFGS